MPRRGAGASPPASPAPADRAAEVAVFPSFPLLPAVAAGLAGTAVAFGGQDLHAADAGAHTGDVSGAQLADAGCRFVLCGHSERRHDHGEGDELVAAKIAAALRHRLVPLVCVGETGERAPRRLDLRGARPPARSALGGCRRRREGAGPSSSSPTSRCGPSAPARRPRPETGRRGPRATCARASPSASARRPRRGRPHPLRRVGEARQRRRAVAQPDVDGFLVGGASLDPEQFLAIIGVCV